MPLANSEVFNPQHTLVISSTDSNSQDLIYSSHDQETVIIINPDPNALHDDQIAVEACGATSVLAFTDPLEALNFIAEHQSNGLFPET